MEINKKYKGIWKIGEDSKEIDGELYNKNGKWILSFNCNYFYEKFMFEQEIISGKLDNGEKITILSPEIYNSKFCIDNMNSYSYCCYECNTIIKGYCFDSLKDIIFKNIYVECEDIQKWLPNKTVKIVKDENNIILLEIKNLEKENYIEFEFYKSFTYNEIINEMENISKLFSLFVGERVYIGHKIKNETEDLEILTYFREYKYNCIKKENKIIAPYKCIKKDLNTIIKNWNNKKEKLIDIVNIFMELISKPIVIPIEILFLLTLQGLESISRRFRDIEKTEDLENKINELCLEVKDDDKRKTLRTILELIDETKLRDLFKVNETTFRKRLKELLKESRIELGGLNSDRRKKLRDNIVETRNHHTHLYDLEENKILSNSDSYFYTMKYLEAVLYELILKELGIDSEEVIKNLNKKYSYFIKRVIDIYN